MEALYKISPNVTLKLEGSNLQEILHEITAVREAIGPEPCGKCGSINTIPQHRLTGGYDFYELKCLEKSCQAVLSLGTNQNADKTLYKKRQPTDNKGKVLLDENGKGKWLPNKGWRTYNPETKEME